MNFYEVDNEGKNAKSHFILANDKEEAMKIAETQKGKPVKARKLVPVDNIPKLCAIGKSGLLAKEVKLMSFAELFSGNTPEQPENPWYIYAEYNDGKLTYIKKFE